MEETKQKFSPASRKAGYSVAVIVNIFLFYLFNYYIPGRNFGFLTHDYAGVLGILNVSIGFAIFSNVVWMFFDPKWLKSVLQIIQNLLGIVFMLVVYTIFPFDFRAQGLEWVQWTRLVIVLGIVAGCIGIVVEAVKLFLRSNDG